MQTNTIQLNNLQNKLSIFQDKLGHTQPLMGELSNHLENIVLNSFERQMSPDGKPWTPIKPSKTDPHPEKILYATGNMQGSLYSKATNDTAIVGLNAVSNGFQYPLTHQFGSKNGWGKGIIIPARPMFPIDIHGKIYDGVEDELMEIVDDFVDNIL